jgi:hypothetical protein
MAATAGFREQSHKDAERMSERHFNAKPNELEKLAHPAIFAVFFLVPTR